MELAVPSIDWACPHLAHYPILVLLEKTLVNMSKAALIDSKQKHFTSIEFFAQFLLRFSAFLSNSLPFCLILVPPYII